MKTPGAEPNAPHSKLAPLSPLMAMLLAGLALADLAGAVALRRAWIADEQDGQLPRAEWRPPGLNLTEVGDASAGAYPHTLTRPLFSKTRRPEAKSAAPGVAPAEAAAPPDFRLAAVASFGETRRAFVVSATSPRGKWLKLGENVDGWTVAGMEPAFVVLESAGVSVKLKLYPDPEASGRRPPRL